MAEERTNLEQLLWEHKIPFTRLREVMGVTSQKTVYNKLHKITDFTISEMRAIRAQLFPDLTFEYIFDGYGVKNAE